MSDLEVYIYILIGALVVAVINIRVFVIFQKSKRKIEQQGNEARTKLYEIAILKELEERIGYSLNIEKVVEIVLGSMRQFVPYTVAAYMLSQGPRLAFRCDLNFSITRNFLNELKLKMLNSLEKHLDAKFGENKIVETLSGAILVDDLTTELKSYFEIPLKIKGKIIGILSLAHSDAKAYESLEQIRILEKIVAQTEIAVSKFEQALELEKGKINSMIESMADGVIMTDRDSRIVVINPAAKAIIGYGPDTEITIFNFIEGLAGTFDIRGRLEESIALKKLTSFDDVKINENYFKIHVAPVKNILSPTEILGGVVIFHDITHEKDLEQMREDFTSMMVHDLRAPLDGIRKMIGMLQSQEENETAIKYFGMIFKEASTMLELVNSLLDIAKLESGQFEIFREEASLQELINEKVAYYTPLAANNKITLKTQISQDLPQKSSFDLVRIGRVLNNLISNALKFTPKAGEIAIAAFQHKSAENVFQEAKKADIVWRVSPADPKILNLPNCLIVAVTDNGCGLKKEDLKIIFEKFRQSSNKGLGERHGTGLGLTIARGILQAHGGILEVASIYSEGTTFWFTLPN